PSTRPPSSSGPLTLPAMRILSGMTPSVETVTAGSGASLAPTPPAAVASLGLSYVLSVRSAGASLLLAQAGGPARLDYSPTLPTEPIIVINGVMWSGARRAPAYADGFTAAVTYSGVRGRMDIVEWVGSSRITLGGRPAFYFSTILDK